MSRKKEWHTEINCCCKCVERRLKKHMTIECKSFLTQGWYIGLFPEGRKPYLHDGSTFWTQMSDSRDDGLTLWPVPEKGHIKGQTIVREGSNRRAQESNRIGLHKKVICFPFFFNVGGSSHGQKVQIESWPYLKCRMGYEMEKEETR